MIGQTLSHYKITSKLGEGGMGEVYRATDTKLNRDVALKVLPEAFAADRERMARFSREAQVLASLNHPNIASIYGLEDSADKHALVLELVEGETLAERIQKGAIPLEESLKIALQMAEAVEAAHEKGIIHRDLKPANVKITPEGKVKVLDFGLAKALEDETPATDLTSSPTRTGTAVGVIMGTAGYMSPEQARGQTIDKRTDIWAFGCVLYEVLTGKQVFGGETLTDILAAIVHNDPNWEALPEGTPRAIQRLLRRCLEKNPHDRLHHIADARIEVREALSEPFGVTPLPVAAPLPRSSWKQALPWALVGIMTVVAFTLTLIDSGEVPQQSGTIHFPVSPPETVSEIFHPSVSPDGKQIVFGGVDQTGRSSLWVRSMDSPIAERLEGTDKVELPFWSPDSRFIGFFADRKLKKIDLSGGPAVSLADAPRRAGGTWNRQETILFAPDTRGPIYRISSAGGEATAITQLDQSRHETAHAFPYFLPDGRHFLYVARAKLAEDWDIYIGSLDSDEHKFLVNASLGYVAYSPPGYLLFKRARTLMAQRFDVLQLEVSGEPIPIAEKTGFLFSVSENGVLAYKSSSLDSRLVWRDRSGKLLETVGEPRDYRHVALSPDQKRVAVTTRELAFAEDIWLIELSTGIFSRFAFSSRNVGPTWSPDGRRLAFHSRRTGPGSLFLKSVGGSEAELLFESKDSYYPKIWSRDGDIIFLSLKPDQSSLDALRLGEEGNGEPRLLLDETLGKDEWQLSPNEKWISYRSDESGRREVYTAAFPDFSSRRQISRAGGAQARWRGDGKELFFLQPDGKLMSVEVRAIATLETGIPKVLFQTPAEAMTHGRLQYCVTNDGQRFLLIEPAEEFEPIHVIVNWAEELKRLVPTEN